jgi:hypothetical protein
VSTAWLALIPVLVATVYSVVWDWLCASGTEDELLVGQEARLERPERFDDGENERS